jgi:hypothetical protein
VSSEPFAAARPSVDVPALTIRWEGLVVAIDANTLNAVARKATQKVPEITEILVEPEHGRLGIAVRVRKGIRVRFRSHLESLRFKHGFLGFRLADLTAFGFFPIPDWVIRKVVDRQPEGRAFFYPESRVIVVNLNHLLPPELSVQVKDVLCENGEMRFLFGPSQYRLDRFIEDLGKDPFADE